METARQLAELRKERDALRTEVEQLKSGKMNERHFSAAFQKEFEKRGEFQAKYHEVLDRCAVSGFEICMELIWCLYSHKSFSLCCNQCGSHSTQNIDFA